MSPVCFEKSLLYERERRYSSRKLYILETAGKLPGETALPFQEKANTHKNSTHTRYRHPRQSHVHT